MDPKEIVQVKQHIKVAQNALAALAAACQANDDAKIKQAMKLYRAAEQKFNALLK
jgi:hypothetical protein